MDPKQVADSTINGFIFGSKADIELADQELNAIKYIDKKLENKSIETVKSVYNASIEKHMFRTPVGYSYLHDLQKRMLKGGIGKEDIQGIPLFQVFEKASDEKPPRVVKVKKPKDKYRRQNAILTLVNIGLVILIIIMFAISMSGSSPTVLNYKHALENEYATWEQELTERENALKQRERELMMNQ